MSLNLKEMSEDGMIEVAEAIGYEGDSNVKLDEIILQPNNLSKENGNLFLYSPGEEVYLFSEEQANDFGSYVFDHTKKFKVAEVKPIPKWSDKPEDEDKRIYLDQMWLNPKQAEIYKSLSIDKLTVVKVADMERIYKFIQKQDC